MPRWARRPGSAAEESTISKISVGFIVAAVFVVAGMALTLLADVLAVEWHAVAAGSRAGTLDPSRQRAYHEIGLAVLSFGLVLAALTFHRWLADKSGWRS